MNFKLRLTRRLGECINIYTSDGLIKIILEPSAYSSNQTQVKIDVPQSVSILRAEIDEKDARFYAEKSKIIAKDIAEAIL
ncbi:carbon storage regulator [Cellvibrio sp. BR]|uniref:carbon storage regulator n=1 Tax=Cellvibrio sp. BR TaxID=1134474 RepID=UPI00058D734E|nr:carbon storage regulator [Cellvibrio sp. BR]